MADLRMLGSGEAQYCWKSWKRGGNTCVGGRLVASASRHLKETYEEMDKHEDYLANEQ